MAPKLLAWVYCNFIFWRLSESRIQRDLKCFLIEHLLQRRRRRPCPWIQHQAGLQEEPGKRRPSEPARELKTAWTAIWPASRFNCLDRVRPRAASPAAHASATSLCPPAAAAGANFTCNLSVDVFVLPGILYTERQRAWKSLQIHVFYYTIINPLPFLLLGSFSRSPVLTNVYLLVRQKNVENKFHFSCQPKKTKQRKFTWNNELPSVCI